MGKPRFRTIITDTYATDTFEMEREVLGRIGAEVVPFDCTTEDQVIEAARGADAIMMREAKVTARVIETLDRCKAIVCCGVGTDGVDLEAATRRRIVVANEPNYCIEEVSNHAFGFLLACSRKFARLDAALRKGVWDYSLLPPMGRVDGETLGLVAIGNIGRRVAQKAQAFGMTVIACDPYVDPDVFRRYDAEPVALHDLLPRADYVSLHVPLTQETFHMIGERELRMMKPSAYLINTSRGKVVEQAALVRALREGWIAGAALDVFETEPVGRDNPLTAIDNVMLTPHTAYHSDEGWKRLCHRVAEDVVRVLTGRWPCSVVNPAIRQKLTLLDA